jgi:hypothetical protein
MVHSFFITQFPVNCKQSLPQAYSPMQHSVSSQDQSAVPIPSAVGKPPTAKQLVGIASLRPESWSRTTTSKSTGSYFSTETSPMEATTAKSQDTPMDDLPNDLFYSSDDAKPLPTQANSKFSTLFAIAQWVDFISSSTEGHRPFSDHATDDSGT